MIFFVCFPFFFLLGLLEKHLRPCDKNCLIMWSQTTVRVKINLLIRKYSCGNIFFFTISLSRFLTDFLHQFQVSEGVFLGKKMFPRKFEKRHFLFIRLFFHLSDFLRRILSLVAKLTCKSCILRTAISILKKKVFFYQKNKVFV